VTEGIAEGGEHATGQSGPAGAEERVATPLLQLVMQTISGWAPVSSTGNSSDAIRAENALVNNTSVSPAGSVIKIWDGDQRECFQHQCLPFTSNVEMILISVFGNIQHGAQLAKDITSQTIAQVCTGAPTVSYAGIRGSYDARCSIGEATYLTVLTRRRAGRPPGRRHLPRRGRFLAPRPAPTRRGQSSTTNSSRSSVQDLPKALDATLKAARVYDAQTVGALQQSCRAHVL
jgi:hypothetical protein